MHNNYFFLKQLTKSIYNKTEDTVISECYSQNKDELIFVFISEGKEFIIKAHLLSTFSCLSFPEQVNRARKNSINIFPEIIDKRLVSIFPYPHERAFNISISDQYLLIFKLFGNYSNILLYKKDKQIALCKHGLKGDQNMDPGNFTSTQDINLHGRIDLKDLPGVIRSFDKNILNFLKENGYDNATEENRKKLLEKVKHYLDSPEYYVFFSNDKLKLSLFSTDQGSKKFSDPIEAINFFYNSYQKSFWFGLGKNNLIKKLQSEINKSISYIENTSIKLKSLTEDINYRQTGDIIMSNLSSIRQGIDQITLFDFYNNRNLEIKLKPILSPQKNAENYYRKGKNQKIEIDILKRNISIRENNTGILKKQLAELMGIEDLRTLKSFIQKYSLGTRKSPAQPAPQFKYYSHLGFRILVGRNAKNNDILTFKHSYKEDLWLHAKDVTGSHVLIKYQSGKSFPKPVIEKAAQLAAYYSKNKNSNTCPVIVTEKKFVRKSKGMPAGAVIVERERMMMVPPIDHPQETGS